MDLAETAGAFDAASISGAADGCSDCLIGGDIWTWSINKQGDGWLALWVMIVQAQIKYSLLNQCQVIEKWRLKIIQCLR